MRFREQHSRPGADACHRHPLLGVPPIPPRSARALTHPTMLNAPTTKTIRSRSTMQSKAMGICLAVLRDPQGTAARSVGKRTWELPIRWPFMVMELETTHDEDHPASFNHTNSWMHVWPFSEIRQEQQRALLEGKHGSFRFVWPFMSQGLQRAIESTSRGSLNMRGRTIAMAMELETTHDEDHPASFNHTKPWAHVWPFSEIRKEQQRSLLETKHRSFRFVWPFTAMMLETTHDVDHPAASNHAKPWVHV